MKKECDILGVKTYSDPPTYFSGSKPPTPRICGPCPYARNCVDSAF